MRRLPPLTEYVSTGPIALTSEERDEIRSSVRGINLAPSPGYEGYYHLTPGPWVGAVNTTNLAIEIRPKFPISRMLFLLSYVLDPRQWQHNQFNVSEESSLLEAIIPAFVSQVSRAFRRGILQGYRPEEDALATVRGRMRFDDQVRNHFGLFPPVEVRYDEFANDIDPNRLIKAAIECLGRIAIRSDAARGSLHAFDAALETVRLVHFDRWQIPSVAYTRLNQHYRPAVELARLILQSSSFEVRNGRVVASTFLVNMNEVFEGFVVIALREALGLSARSFPREALGRLLFLDAEGRIKLEPDLSWWEGDMCVFVGDAKYKDAGTQGVVGGDLYQLLAYTTAAGLPGGLLIYASGSAPSITHHITRVNKDLQVMGLDLSGAPDSILEQVQEAAQQIRQLRIRISG